MVYLRFILLLFGLLLVFNALKDYADANQDWEMGKSKLQLVAGDIDVSNQKEFLDGLTATTTRTRKFGFRGRKLMEVGIHNEVTMRKGTEEKDDVISGKENGAILKSLQESSYHYQKNKHNLKESASLRSARTKATAQLSNTSPNPNHSTKNSKHLPTKASLKTLTGSENHPSDHHHNDRQTKASAPKDEKQKLLEATKEIANLMNKDYKGMDRPRRKPPINNHIPFH